MVAESIWREDDGDIEKGVLPGHKDCLHPAVLLWLQTAVLGGKILDLVKLLLATHLEQSSLASLLSTFVFFNTSHRSVTNLLSWFELTV